MSIREYVTEVTPIFNLASNICLRLKHFCKVIGGFSYFRGHVGGMKYVKRNSKHCSDANVHLGHIVGVQDDITTRCVPWLRPDTFGISPTPILGHPASDNRVWKKTNEELTFKDALRYFHFSFVSLGWNRVNNKARAKYRFLFETDLAIEIKFRLILSITSSLTNLFLFCHPNIVLLYVCLDQFICHSCWSWK